MVGPRHFSYKFGQTHPLDLYKCCLLCREKCQNDVQSIKEKHFPNLNNQLMKKSSGPRFTLVSFNVTLVRPSFVNTGNGQHYFNSVVLKSTNRQVVQKYNKQEFIYSI